MQVLQKREGMTSPELIDGTIFDFEKGSVAISRHLDKQPEAIVEKAASQLLTRALESGASTRLLKLSGTRFEQITGLVVYPIRHRN
jgi:hypothetical protein